jgi:hypothetical protein
MTEVEVAAAAICHPGSQIDAGPLHHDAERSAARERLARAFADHAAAADRLRRLHMSIEAARAESFAKFQTIGACEAIVETARKEEPRRRAAALLGEQLAPAPDVDQASRNLLSAREEYGEAQRLIAALEQEAGLQAFRHAAAQTALSDAIRAVLEADPSFAALEVEFLRARAWVEALAEAFRTLGQFLPRRSARWDRTNPELPALACVSPAELVGAWLGTIREGETDAAFPEFGVFGAGAPGEADFGEVEVAAAD